MSDGVKRPEGMKAPYVMPAMSQYMMPYSSMDEKEKVPLWPWNSALVR